MATKKYQLRNGYGEAGNDVTLCDPFLSSLLARDPFLSSLLAREPLVAGEVVIELRGRARRRRCEAGGCRTP